MRHNELLQAQGLELETLIIHSVLQDAFGSDVGSIRVQSIVSALRDKATEEQEKLPFTIVKSFLFDAGIETTQVYARDAEEARSIATKGGEDVATTLVFTGHQQPL
jgi:hypothetical protein